MKNLPFFVAKGSKQQLIFVLKWRIQKRRIALEKAILRIWVIDLFIILT